MYNKGSKKVRTGIYGGSFNPIHLGHITMATQLIRHNMVDEVWFVVSPQNPLKTDDTLWPDELRLQLAREAVAGIEHLQVSDIEFSMPRPSYMADTLQRLTEEHPDREFHLIIGQDNWDCFHQWYHWQEILRQYPIIVLPRNTQEGNVTFAQFPPVDISSTWIRSQISHNPDYSGQGLAPSVWNSIRKVFRLSTTCIACLLMMAICLASCSPDVDLCTSHDHRGKVNISFNWAEVPYRYPSQVQVFALRPIRHDNLRWTLPSIGISSVTLEGGDYQFTAFTGRAETTSSEDIQVSYNLAQSLTDPRFRGLFLKMKDRNPYSCYIVATDSTALYTASTEHSIPLKITMPDSADYQASDTINVRFAMHSVSQRVAIRFAMHADSIDGIDSVRCIMSGIGKSVHISTGNVNIDTTYKAPFAPLGALTPDPEGLYHVEHTIDVPGIVRNSSQSSVSGPGILQVDVYVHFHNTDGLHNVMLTGILNLYRLLAKTPSLVYDAKGVPTQSAPEITLDIDDVMTVSRSRITGSLEGSLGSWTDDSRITIDY